MQVNCWSKFRNKIFLESKFKTGTGNMLEKCFQKYIKLHGDKNKIKKKKGGGEDESNTYLPIW